METLSLHSMNLSGNSSLTRTLEAGNVSSVDMATHEETLAELNSRYATALLPLSVCLGLLGCFGIVGNILVFIVYGFGKKFKDKKYRVYVLCLATIDLITCITLIPAEIIKHRAYFNFVEAHLCKTKCFFNVFAASAASFCLLIVAMDRYLLTCHPMLSVKIRAFSSKVALRLCITMIFLGAISAIPSAIMCGTSKHYMPNINGNVTEVYLCSVDAAFETSTWRFTYRYALVITQSLVSVVVATLYIRIGQTVWMVMKIRHVTSVGTPVCVSKGNHNFKIDTPCTSESKYEGQMHSPTQLPSNLKLLFLVTVVFIVTYFLYIGLSFIDIVTLSPIEFVYFSIFFRLYFIHSVINPILYFKMDSLFRKRCVALFQRSRSY